MKQNQALAINENESQNHSSQLLGFLPPGRGVLILSTCPQGQNGAPPVMAIPIAELFVKHENPRQTIRRSQH
jgi:hypothetical protein